MTHLMLELAGAVSDARGTFRARAMARGQGDGGWEGWLEFVPATADGTSGFRTTIETHQRDRVAMQRWASGLTRVYAEGALSRARVVLPSSADPGDLRFALHEIVEALDRRLPHLERAGETHILADAARLRESATHRLADLQRAAATPRPKE
jgi:hypothetical protein